jgi:hypothetical protein
MCRIVLIMVNGLSRTHFQTIRIVYQHALLGVFAVWWPHLPFGMPTKRTASDFQSDNRSNGAGQDGSPSIVARRWDLMQLGRARTF